MIAAARRRDRGARARRREAWTRAAVDRDGSTGCWSRAWPRSLRRGGPRGRRLGLRWARPPAAPACGVFLLRACAGAASGGCCALAAWRAGATAGSAVLTPQRAICWRSSPPAPACRLPVRRLPRRSRSASRATRACRRSRRRRPSAPKTAGRGALLPAGPGGAARRRRSAVARAAATSGGAASAGSSSPSACSASPSILLVDLPAGLDAGAQASRFAGATAVLDDGFYAELAGGRARAGLLRRTAPTMRGRAEHESTCPQGPQAP